MDKRIVLAAIVLLGGIGITVAGATPQSAMTPTSALEAGAGDATVKGMVEAVDRPNGTFNLSDEEAVVTVHYQGALPTQVEAGKGLVASGVLVEQDAGLVLVADEIRSGCPSKYEA